MADDWKHASGAPYEYPIFKAVRAMVFKASWLREDGVEPIVLLQLSGEMEGLPLTIGVELTQSGCVKVAEGLGRAVAE